AGGVDAERGPVTGEDRRPAGLPGEDVASRDAVDAHGEGPAGRGHAEGEIPEGGLGVELAAGPEEGGELGAEEEEIGLGAQEETPRAGMVPGEEEPAPPAVPEG